MDNHESKLSRAKQQFDNLIGLPGSTLRRGVARHGDPFAGYVDYNFKLLRNEDREWSLYVEWVDLDGEGHRVVLPNPVVAGVLQRAASIIAQARKERAQRGAETRRRKQVELGAKGE